jgi:hypothetical protein
LQVSIGVHPTDGDNDNDNGEGNGKSNCSTEQRAGKRGGVYLFSSGAAEEGLRAKFDELEKPL